MPDRCAVLIVGAGPAGLAAAVELARQGVRDVVVVEREDEAGGMPRMCHHTGFGIRDLHGVYTGPGYAERYRAKAAAAGIEVRTSTTVTAWSGPNTVSVTSPRGIAEIRAQAILLATGCYERPRAGRLVHGRRPQGVFTTGSLQRFVHQHHEAVGRRAVVVGAEIVSFSALLTLGDANGRAVAMVTEHPAVQLPSLYTPAKWYLAGLRRVPIFERTRVQAILGGRRVEAVELLRLDSGATEIFPCDTVIFSGAWMSESELLRLASVGLDGATRAPQVDPSLRTAVPGVFAAGNLLHGALAADQAGLEGRYAACQIARYLQDGAWPHGSLPLAAGQGVEWVSPNLISRGATSFPFGAFLFQTNAFFNAAEARISQGERVLYRRAFRRIVPNRPMRLDAAWLAQVDHAGPALRLDIA